MRFLNFFLKKSGYPISMTQKKHDKRTFTKLENKDFIRYKLFEDKKSLFQKYAELVIGNSSLHKLIIYEILTSFIGPLPGAMGLLLRKMFFPYLFQSVGKSISIGKSLTIRHPDKIKLGNRVVIDDYSLIDARGSGDEGVSIGDDVFIGRGVIIQSKVGPISIGHSVSIGAGSSLIAQGGIFIDEMVNIAGACNISGGSYQVGRDKSSLREHDKQTKGPIHIGRKCRFGMGTMVLDGVHIKEGTILGAMSLVAKDLPEYCIAAGIPAEIKSFRKQKSEIVD